MATSRTKYIGYSGTATLLLLISWFVISDHFSVEYEGDKFCLGSYEDPCEWNYNITLTTVSAYYIQNKDLVNLVFLPEVREFYNCKKDGRYRSLLRADREKYPCGIGYREFDWKTPLTSKYKYINKFYKGKKQEFKLVVFKNNPTDTIKFGGTITKNEFDPYFYGIDVKKIEKCHIEHDYIISPVYEDCDYNYTYTNNVTKVNETKLITRQCFTGKSSTEIINNSVCETIDFEVNGKRLECDKLGIICYRDGFKICGKIAGQSDMNNPICSENSGEAYLEWDIRDISKIIPVGISKTSSMKVFKLE